MNGLPAFGWSRTGGDLRVPHFWALHAHQLVPLLVWVLADHLGWVKARAGVMLIAVLYAAGVVGVFVQALSGQPFLFALSGF